MPLAEAVREPTPAAALPSLPDDDEEDDEDAPPPPRWEDIPTSEKLRCHGGVCYPVVSDAWGCCLTSCGCSWNDRINCLGLDVKGLYSPCVQVEAMALKPAFDKAHPDVYCVLCQGYTYGVVPEPKLCKGSQQACCVQNRCSLPCDDEVPTTCTCLGYQRCRRVRKTGYTFELVPFLPYPEVRIMDEEALKRGGDADDFNLHWALKGCLNAIGELVNTRQHRIVNSCCGVAQSAGCDFPTCVGASVSGSCLLCVEVNCVACKPVERHPRVECIFTQGGAYVAKPRGNPACGYSLCKGTASVCCLEHRYAFPPEESLQLFPVLCTLCGGQCCQFGPVGVQHECNRACCVRIAPLPRVKPSVAEASDVVYHETRAALKNQLASNVQPSEGAGGDVAGHGPQEQLMQRV
jgi:hypothetical protein